MRRGDSVREPGALAMPAAVYYAAFFLAPLMIIVAYAFAQKSGFFDITFGFYTDSFQRLWDPLYLGIYRNSLTMALIGTVGCLLIGFPFAYWLATRVRNKKTLLLVLVIIPFWTSILIRTYAWSLILSPQGPLSTFLQNLGVISNPLGILFTPRAVFIGIVYDYLPLMVFPLYVAIERMDRGLVEASRDLGVGRLGTLWRVTIPLTMPGIITGCLLVFVPMTGEYVVPTILGGAKQPFIGTAVADQFLSAINYPFGAAMSVGLVAFLLVVIFVYLRAVGRQAESNLGASL
ncbi:MAG TPA: ABC transporter permease [Actinomycetota bacterium]|jgi:spermidine/putrescine transport system permease protein|nr:ABC transporter permease [Actinomycetota bacterium]